MATGENTLSDSVGTDGHKGLTSGSNSTAGSNGSKSTSTEERYHPDALTNNPQANANGRYRSTSLSRADYEEEEEEEENHHITKFGKVNFRYIKKPKHSVWFTRPYALNYFKDGVLYRTKEERSSSKLELFLDLMYVGIVANLAGEASENASGISLLKYFLFFIPTWVVWADVKDSVNYYYNEDLSQKTYMFWILCLLTLYVNSHDAITESVDGAALTVVPYILLRMTPASCLLFYSLWIVEHRFQMRMYACSMFITSSLWIIVIFIGNRAKVGVSFAIMFLEQLCYSLAFHPFTKKVFKLRMSTALNIEHEVERMATFTTIAIGEFLYKAVANNPLGRGLTPKFARGIFLILIAYNLFWIYNHGSTCKKSVHALRRSANTAILWIYAHLPLIACLVLAADAGGELTSSDYTSTKRHHSESSLSEEPINTHGELRLLGSSLFRRAEEEPELNMYALSFFFTGGISFSLISMFIIGMVDKDLDPKGLHIIPRIFRIGLRIPAAIIIILVSLAELNTTLLLGIVAAITSFVFFYESIVLTPVSGLSLLCTIFPEAARKAHKIEQQQEQEENDFINRDIEILQKEEEDVLENNNDAFVKDLIDGANYVQSNTATVPEKDQQK